MSIPCLPLQNVEYRLALIDPDSHTVLTCVNLDDSRQLPRVDVPQNVRSTAYLRKALRSTWDLQGIVLDYLPADSSYTRCAAVELLSKKIPQELQPTNLDDVPSDALSPIQRISLRTLLSQRSENPFFRIGWLHEAIDWLEETTGERISSTGDIEQLNASGRFALLRFPCCSGRSYWLKATGGPNAHELAITFLLSKLCSHRIPEVLATKPKWNAWIMRHQGSSVPFPLDPIRRLTILKSAVSAMAEIQLQSIGHDRELLASGAFDQRFAVLLADSTLLFEKISEAMSLQTSTIAPRIEGRRLDELRDVFDRICDYLQTVPIPNTVLHGDMNPGNILFSADGCQFIDWSETFVGHPFVTLQHLLLLNRTDNEQIKSRWDSTLIECYRAVMRDAFDPDAFERALVCMPMLAAASALYGRGEWLRRPLAETLYRQTRIRTLARCMERASRDSALLNLIRPPRVSKAREREAAICSH